eukprot:COSAG05_NODE_8982_length_657_cov_0.826165_2_plen_191_part_01
MTPGILQQAEDRGHPSSGRLSGGGAGTVWRSEYLECLDRDFVWYAAMILRWAGDRALIHYIGWQSMWNEWFDIDDLLLRTRPLTAEPQFGALRSKEERARVKRCIRKAEHQWGNSMIAGTHLSSSALLQCISFVRQQESRRASTVAVGVPTGRLHAGSTPDSSSRVAAFNTDTNRHDGSAGDTSDDGINPA